MYPFNVTSLSSRGQIVIPPNLRKELGMVPGIKLIMFIDGSNLLLKPVHGPKTKDFHKLIKESRILVEKKKMQSSDVRKIIKQIRNENSS